MGSVLSLPFVFVVVFLLLPVHLMAVPADIMALYSQYDFIPDEIYKSWSESGFPIGAILEWLMVPQGLANAYLTSLGTDTHGSD